MSIIELPIPVYLPIAPLRFTKNTINTLAATLSDGVNSILPNSFPTFSHPKSILNNSNNNKNKENFENIKEIEYINSNIKDNYFKCTNPINQYSLGIILIIIIFLIYFIIEYIGKKK